MEERDGIPEDIMEAVRKLARDEQFRLAAVFGTAFVDEGTVEAIARAILAERLRSLEAAKKAIHCPCDRYCDFNEAEEKIDELIDAIRNP